MINLLKNRSFKKYFFIDKIKICYNKDTQGPVNFSLFAVQSFPPIFSKMPVYRIELTVLNSRDLD
jgi:hypothetical protein